MGKQPKHSLQFEAHFSADRSSSATLVSSLPLLEVGAVALEEAAALTMNVAAGKAGGRFYLDI